MNSIRIHSLLSHQTRKSVERMGIRVDLPDEAILGYIHGRSFHDACLSLVRIMVAPDEGTAVNMILDMLSKGVLRGFSGLIIINRNHRRES